MCLFIKCEPDCTVWFFTDPRLTPPPSTFFLTHSIICLGLPALLQARQTYPSLGCFQVPFSMHRGVVSLTTWRLVPSLHSHLLKYFHLQEDLLDQLKDSPSFTLHLLTLAFYRTYHRLVFRLDLWADALPLNERFRRGESVYISTLYTTFNSVLTDLRKYFQSKHAVWGRWRKEWMGVRWSHTGPSVSPFHFLDLE